MTIIQPEKKSILNFLLVLAFSLLFISSLILIVLYNYVVNFNKNIVKMEKDIKQFEIQTTELTEKIFDIVSGDNLEKIAQEYGMVKENNPEYLEINSKSWQLGLNY